MDKKQDKLTTAKTEKHNVKNYRTDALGAISGINTPGIDLPAFNPPVPNRAWTAMRQGLDIEDLSEEEKRDMYFLVGNHIVIHISIIQKIISMN